MVLQFRTYVSNKVIGLNCDKVMPVYVIRSMFDFRIMQVGLQITRPPENVARYKMIKHTKRKPSDYRKR